MRYKKYIWIVGLFLALAALLFFRTGRELPAASITSTADVPPASTPKPARTPESIPIADDPLKESILAAGDYLVRQQLPNGELSYQVDFMTGERSYSPSHVRLMGGTGALFTVCRVSGDLKYCEAGDLALDHYLEMLVTEPARFKGDCLYTEGTCQLGGAALTVDAIYKRWQASGDFFLNDRNLLETAIELGYFIVSMRKPEGGFYHSYDPHFGGTVDADFYVTYFPGESLLALMQLYEMTGNDFWLKQARGVNEFMIAQPVTEDHWHSHALAMLARQDSLTKADLGYSLQIAKTVIAGEVRSLNLKNTSMSSATKIESLAALAQAFYLSGEDHEWLDPEIRALITYVQARQLPNNNCGWSISDETAEKFSGGIFSNCEDPSIRIDGLQNWINGVTAYLEYKGLAEKKQ